MNSAATDRISLRMTRANLDHLPALALPPGFALRWFQPGDAAHWLTIHRAADHFNAFTPETFHEQFAMAEQLLPERQAFLLDPHGDSVGTVTAWFNDDFEGTRWGRVHWLAVLPQFQGRGLGKALLVAACRRLRELGHDRAYLTTAAFRLTAIRLYLRLGFVPLIRNETDAAAWQPVRAALPATLWAG